MSEYVGLDVSKKETSFCIVDEAGKVLCRGAIDSTPDAIFEMLSHRTLCPSRIVLETGTLSNWLTEELVSRGLPVSCICARQANAVMAINPNKTDDNDAEMLAALARTGFYREVQVKSLRARKRRALLKARHQLTKQRRDIDNTVRGLLSSFGLTFPKGAALLPERVKEALADRPDLAEFIGPLQEARAACLAAFSKLDERLLSDAKHAQDCRLLMTAPGVGPVVAMTFVATTDDPGRFHNARAAGAYCGLTSRRFQSGNVDYTGKISKFGDRLVRAALYEAANVLLTRVRRSHPIRDWALRLEKKVGSKKAKVALARKLAVVLLAMWRSGEPFRWNEGFVAKA